MSGEAIANAIPLVNKIQNFFAFNNESIGFDLPQIAVIGTQSVGKSLILENFVGREFLPRGNDVVTRCPLVLQLRQNEGGESYGEFAHVKEDNGSARKFYDFLEIRKEIENQTRVLAGVGKVISKQHISLTIFSPDVLDLTLVDLPGVTRVAAGNQGGDIEQKTRSLAKSFISNPNCLILAVSHVTADLSTSDALLLAREVDPEGKRTIGVLTKIDKEKEEVMIRYLKNAHANFPLERGYISVINRETGPDDESGMPVAEITLQEALEHEEKIFASHIAYQETSYRQGTRYLRQYLGEELNKHIKLKVPELRQRIRNMTKELETKLEATHKDPTPEERIPLILQLTREVLEKFLKSMGDLSTRVDDTDSDELCVGTALRVIFDNDFEKEAYLNIDEIKYNEKIRREIKNADGLQENFFAPSRALDRLAQSQVGVLEKPSLNVVERVCEKLLEQIDENLFTNMIDFPKMQREARRAAREFLEGSKKKAEEQIKLLIKLEKSLVATKHKNLHESTFKPNNYWSMVSTMTQHRGISFTSTNCSIKMNNNASDVRLKDAVLRLTHTKSLGTDQKSWFMVELIPFGRTSHMTPQPIEILKDEMTFPHDVMGAFSKAGFFLSNTTVDSKSNIQYSIVTSTYEMEEESVLQKIRSVRLVVDDYIDVVKKTMQSIVPKVIVAMIINEQIKFLEVQMPPNLLKNGESLCVLDPTVAAERARMERQLKSYSGVSRIFDEVEELQ
uniref:GED domain-containing protein n=1 Tax=Steinernema glaseri TaxID=37863 RepID=A0A1I7ZG19_9BILA